MSDTDPFALEKRIQSSEGYRIKRLIDALNSSYYVFRQNYFKLKLILTASADPEFMLPVLDVRNRTNFDTFIDEIRRKLHNYLAGAQTLIDHTRNMIDDAFADSDFHAEYKREIATRFVDNPLAKFIKDLRNYTTHFGLPATVSNLKLHPIDGTNQGQIECFASLDKQSLKHWSKWSKPAAVFIEGLPEEPIIAEIVDAYYERVESFYQWLIGRLREIYKTDLQLLEQMVDEYHRTFPDME